MLAFLRREDGTPKGRRYEIDGVLAARLREEAHHRGLAEREVLEHALRLYLGGRREGGGP